MSCKNATPRLAFLAGPISNGVEGFVQDQLLKVFASDAFATAWEQANRFVHAQLIAALEGGERPSRYRTVQWFSTCCRS